MFEYVPDNYDLYDQEDARRERDRERFPKCEFCGERVEDDHYYDLWGTIVCPDCMKERFRKDIEDWEGDE